MIGIESSQTTESKHIATTAVKSDIENNPQTTTQIFNESTTNNPNPLATTASNKVNKNGSVSFLRPRPKHDVCIVFPVDPDTKLFYSEGRELIKKISNVIGQQNLFIYRSIEFDQIFVLLGVTIDKMQNFADLSEFFFLADPDNLRERCLQGWPESVDNEGDTISAIKPLTFTEDRPDITKYTPYEYIYLKYEYEEDFKDLYYKNSGEKDIFTDRHRINVIKKLLEDPEEFGCCELNFVRLMDNVVIEKSGAIKTKIPTVTAIYPLHNKHVLKELREIIFSTYHYRYPWIRQPIEEIRDYFG